MLCIFERNNVRKRQCASLAFARLLNHVVIKLIIVSEGEKECRIIDSHRTLTN